MFYPTDKSPYCRSKVTSAVNRFQIRGTVFRRICWGKALPLFPCYSFWGKQTVSQATHQSFIVISKLQKGHGFTGNFCRAMETEKKPVRSVDEWFRAQKSAGLVAGRGIIGGPGQLWDYSTSDGFMNDAVLAG